VNRVSTENITFVLNQCSSSKLCKLDYCANSSFLSSVKHLPNNVFIIACNNTVNVFSIVEKTADRAYKRAIHVVNAFMQNCANTNVITINLNIVYRKSPPTNENAIINKKFNDFEKNEYHNNYYLDFKVPKNGTIICY